MSKIKFTKTLFDLTFAKNANNYSNVLRSRSTIKLNAFQNRCFCDNSSDLLNSNKIIFKFSNGFFKFQTNESNFIISYWTPLRSVIQLMDNSPESTALTKVVDESNKVVFSSATPVGFVFSNLENLSFKVPALGLCQFQFEGNVEDLITWKERMESGLQYGSEGGVSQQKSLEDHELSFLEHEKSAIKTMFRPLLKEYQQIVSLARTDAHRKFKWGGLFLLSAQLGFVARLTWFEYSWDIMEPITWMLTYAMMVGTFAYYIVTSQEYLVPSVERRLTINKFWKLAQKQNFDVSKFRKLREQIKQLDEKILRLKTSNF